MKESLQTRSEAEAKLKFPSVALRWQQYFEQVRRGVQTLTPEQCEAIAGEIYVALAAFGLGALLSAAPALLTALKLLGGGYLCYLAARALIGALGGGNVAYGTARPRWGLAEAWHRGLLVNLTNPKAALMWSAVATFLFGSGLSAWQVLAFAPVGFASAVVVYGVYAILFRARPRGGVTPGFTD